MEVLVDPKTPGRVLYLSHFKSEDAFQKNATGPTFQKWLPELGKYFITSKTALTAAVALVFGISALTATMLMSSDLVMVDVAPFDVVGCIIT